MTSFSRSPIGARNFERVNITLKKELNAAAKAYAKENGYTLSGLIAKALTQEIGGETERILKSFNACTKRIEALEADIAILKKARHASNVEHTCSVSNSKIGNHSPIHIDAIAKGKLSVRKK